MYPIYVHSLAQQQHQRPRLTVRACHFRATVESLSCTAIGHSRNAMLDMHAKATKIAPVLAATPTPLIAGKHGVVLHANTIA